MFIIEILLVLSMFLGLSFVFMMAPITSSSIPGGTRYGFPILGDLSERLSERLDVSTLYNTGLVDSDGYLIPGAVLRKDGQYLVPISAGAQTARGIIFEAVKVAQSNSQAHLDAATDYDVVIAVAATIDRAIAEYNLDRDYTADELTAFGNNDRLTLSDPET